MSRSATPTTRNEATRRLKPPKMIPSAELTIGKAMRGSRERLRTVANVNATSSEHTLNPQTPRVKREPLLCIREKANSSLAERSFDGKPVWAAHGFQTCSCRAAFRRPDTRDDKTQPNLAPPLVWEQYGAVGISLEHIIRVPRACLLYHVPAAVFPVKMEDL